MMRSIGISQKFKNLHRKDKKKASVTLWKPPKIANYDYSF
jgi:hypothetical protein